MYAYEFKQYIVIFLRAVVLIKWGGNLNLKSTSLNYLNNQIYCTPLAFSNLYTDIIRCLDTCRHPLPRELSSVKKTAVGHWLPYSQPGGRWWKEEMP